MELATVWVEVNAQHDNVRLTNISPAEALILKRQFGLKIAGTSKTTDPISHLEITATDSERTSEEDYERLNRKYGEKTLVAAFPGENPALPPSFKAAGFTETEDKEPKKGKEQEIRPLADLPKGDSGADMEPGTVTKQEEVIKQQQATIERLTSLVEKVASAKSGSNIDQDAKE